MDLPKTSCERPCGCAEIPVKPRFVVLTGGPGAGKTAVLEIARKLFCSHVALLPESASIVYGGGFWRLPSSSARSAAQRAIFHVQSQMERLVTEEARWGTVLCDRGSLDSLAYWPGREQQYWADLETTRDLEMAKYFQVIHLRSPTEHDGYNLSNPLRIESAVEAVRIDERIADVWGSHPNYQQIQCTPSFTEKADRAIRLISGALAPCCHRDFVRSASSSGGSRS